MGRYLASARNGVWGTSGDLKVVYNEAVLSRGREPGIHNCRFSNFSHPVSRYACMIQVSFFPLSLFIVSFVFSCFSFCLFYFNVFLARAAEPSSGVI